MICKKAYSKGPTHRPGELEGDHDLASFIKLIARLKRKHISTENFRRSRPEDAGSSGGHLHLVLLQAHFEVSVALASAAAMVPRAPGAAAAFPVCPLPVRVLQGHQLQLEGAGGLGHLDTTS